MRAVTSAHLARIAVIGTIGLALAGQAAVASAAVFNVSPTKVILTPQQSSALVTLTNDSDKTVRFQLIVAAWDQSIDGQMKLAGTSDVIVYPPMVSIAAHESRRIRVGAVVPAGAVESSYRLFVEELPDEADLATGARAVQVRTRMGIPVFLRTGKTGPVSQIDALTMRDGTLDFDVRNTGTSHTVLQSVQVRGLADGREVFSSTAKGWYLLAQHRQSFHLPIDAAQCAAARQLLLTATTDDGVVTTGMPVPAGACAARR